MPENRSTAHADGYQQYVLRRPNRLVRKCNEAESARNAQKAGEGTACLSHPIISEDLSPQRNEQVTFAIGKRPQCKQKIRQHVGFWRKCTHAERHGRCTVQRRPDLHGLSARHDKHASSMQKWTVSRLSDARKMSYQPQTGPMYVSRNLFVLMFVAGVDE